MLVVGLQEWQSLRASGEVAADLEGACFATREALRDAAALCLAEMRRGEVNITPLVDVMLVLLIIFMAITPVASRGIDAPCRDRSPRQALLR